MPGGIFAKTATRSNLQPVLYAANLLDHRYYGSNVDHAEVCKPMGYIYEYKNDVTPEVSKYLAKMARYSPSFLFADNYNNVSARAWWIAGDKMRFDKELVLLASTLLGACPSSSGLKRCFLTLEFIYGKLRPQLGVEKAEKPSFQTIQFLIVTSLPKINNISYKNYRIFR